MYKDKTFFSITTVFIFTVILWIIFVATSHYSATYEGSIYKFILKPFLIGMTVLPLLGGILGLHRSKEWGGHKSAMGRSLLALSLGQIFWGIGMVIWNYYLFMNIEEVPYPSLADASFILSWPLWTLGIIYLSRATGVKFALRQAKGKLLLVFVPLVAIIASYYLLIGVARGGQIEWDTSHALKLFFDLFYPIGSAAIFTMVLTFYSLSMGFLGGRYRLPILILIFAFVVNFLSDFTFSFTTTKETYFNGHIVDFMFTCAMYLLALSLVSLTPKLADHDNSNLP
ncbi:hypothetical protein KW785_03505 [Candidatus Parcubacteria bacterium]|nr:hypothetical protein [Candidatus Parcubacteria bacterium]